jgi:hypothetical protein
MMGSQASIVSSAVGSAFCSSTPALLKAKSSRPNTLIVSSRAFLDLLLLRYIALDRVCLSTSLLDQRCGFLDASWLVSEGVDVKTVSSMLHPSNIKTTLGIYSHAVGSKQLAAQGQYLDTLLSNASVQ